VSGSDNVSYLLLINIDDYEEREYDPFNFKHFYFYDSYYIFINLMIFIFSRYLLLDYQNILLKKLEPNYGMMVTDYTTLTYGEIAEELV